MRPPFPLHAAALLNALLAGCASDPTYTCSTETGSHGCRSVSQVHADGEPAGRSPPKAPAIDLAAANQTPAVAVPTLGDALLTRPKVIRIYLLPWEDSSGDLNAGSYLYLRMGRGEWTLGQP